MKSHFAMAVVIMLAGIGLLGALASNSEPARAVEPDEILAEPHLEQRARALSVQLRCLVCQNQSIDDSDAPLARDLRVLVRQQISDGASDPQIIDFLIARYGEFILLKPRWRQGTWLLWLAPLALLICGILLVVVMMRRQRSRAEDGLSRQEQQELRNIMATRDD